MVEPDIRWRRRNNNLQIAAETLEAMKLASGCVDCGYREHPAALHFDHVDPATKRRELGWVDDRSKLVTVRRLRDFIAHVEKYCQVRCANCHAVRSATEKHHSLGRTAPATASTLF